MLSLRDKHAVSVGECRDNPGKKGLVGQGLFGSTQDPRSRTLRVGQPNVGRRISVDGARDSVSGRTSASVIERENEIRQRLGHNRMSFFAPVFVALKSKPAESIGLFRLQEVGQ